MANFSKNPFALLGDDDGDSGSAPVAAPKAPKAAAAAPATGIQQATQRNVPGRDGTRGRPKSDYPSRGAPRNVFRPEGQGQSRGPAAGDDGFNAVNGRDDRAERTRGGSRGARGGRGAPRGGRGLGRGGRPDRHSQTGVHDSEKKEHQGWGGDDGKRELEAEDDGAADATNEVKSTNADGTPAVAAGDGWAADADGAEKPADWAAGEGAAPATSQPNGAPAAPVEEEDNTISYDEYLANQAGGLSIEGVEERAARQANAGADESQWKDAVAVLRKDAEDEAYFAATKVKAQKERKAKEGKQLIEIEPRFAPVRRDGPGGRGGRGGRGGDRGAGPRSGGDRPPRRDGDRPPRGRDNNAGGFRGGRGGQPRTNQNFNVDDQSAFPSLS